MNICLFLWPTLFSYYSYSAYVCVLYFSFMSAACLSAWQAVWRCPAITHKVIDPFYFCNQWKWFSLLLTYSMAHSPWKADSSSPSQEIPHLLQKWSILYCVHKGPPMISILSQMNPIHTLISCFFMIYITITFPSVPRSPKWSVPFWFTD